MDTRVAPKAGREASTLALWAGLLAGPLAWGGQFLVGYILVPKATTGWGFVPLHLTTVGGLLVTALGGWVAWRAWRGNGGGWPTPADEGGGARVRFLAVQGLLTAALSAAVIVFQWFAFVLLDPRKA